MLRPPTYAAPRWHAPTELTLRARRPRSSAAGAALGSASWLNDDSSSSTCNYPPRTKPCQDEIITIWKSKHQNFNKRFQIAHDFPDIDGKTLIGLPDDDYGRGHEKGWGYFLTRFADQFPRKQVPTAGRDVVGQLT